jgi:hypothetical protein
MSSRALHFPPRRPDSPPRFVCLRTMRFPSTTRMLPRAFQQIMLMVLLFPGARPVAHTHDQFAETHQAIRELENHLDWYHTQSMVAIESSHEWHIHWVFPRCVNGSMPSDEAVIQNEWISFQSTIAIWTSPIRQVAIERFASQQRLLNLAVLSLDPNRSRQFVNRLSSELSLPELLGVMQC